MAAAGSPRIVTPDMVKPGAAVVAAGTTFEGKKVISDVNEGVAEVAGWLSPRLGGVGPMTRAMLSSKRRGSGREGRLEQGREGRLEGALQPEGGCSSYDAHLGPAHERPDLLVRVLPPKNDTEQATLVRTLRDLEPLSPSFVSVTYRGGRESRQRTFDLVTGMLRTTTLTPMAHLICVAHAPRARRDPRCVPQGRSSKPDGSGGRSCPRIPHTEKAILLTLRNSWSSPTRSGVGR